MSVPTDADRVKAAEILRPVGFVFDRAVAERRIAAALAAEREAALAPVLALAAELADDARRNLARRDLASTYIGRTYCDTADRILAAIAAPVAQAGEGQ